MMLSTFHLIVPAVKRRNDQQPYSSRKEKSADKRYGKGTPERTGNQRNKTKYIGYAGKHDRPETERRRLDDRIIRLLPICQMLADLVKKDDAVPDNHAG